MDLYWIVGIVVAILIISYWIFSGTKKNTRENYDIHSESYYASVKKQLSSIEQQQLQTQIEAIQSINRMVAAKNRELKYINQRAEHEIRQKIIAANKQIEQRWNSSSKSNFYYCLSVHYQSFTLADAVKMDSNMLQAVIKDSLAPNIRVLSEQITQLQNKIDARLAVSADYAKIKQLREIRKDYLAKRDYLNSLIEPKESFVKHQNAETSQMKNYIRTHFGRRGREWADRIERKHKRG